MKYIRTKDGIYEVGELVETESTILDKLHTKCYLKQNIIAKADTIEELCDEFVLYDNLLNTYGVFDKKVITFKWLKEHFGLYDKGMTLYGAIWTLKGLIFVTKMNEKGELELIV